MKTRDSSRCPDPEVLAAFVAGTLSEDELRMTANHIRECEDCRIILAEAARVDREEADHVPAHPESIPMARKARPAVSPWWLVAAAAALLGLAFLALFRLPQSRPGIPTLASAAPRDGRDLEPRLSGGFAWAPLRPVKRTTVEPSDPAQMKLIGAAGAVLEATEHDASIEGRHAKAMAHLLTGHPDQANAILAKAAEDAHAAAVWSDLAAARFAEFQQSDNPARLAEALVAADGALRIDAAYPEALFNRALIVERLGLRDEARAAWNRYLQVDRTSQWAREAEAHLSRLNPPVSFKEELERSYDALARDPSVARTLVARFPQDTRVWGETEILGRWAEALQEKRDADALRHLAVARQFGDEIVESRDDAMLSGAVSAIDRADRPTLDTLAAAHISFRRAQQTYGQGRPADAQVLFEKAVVLFEKGGSPLARVARYFVANTRYDQGHVEESRDRLERLRAEAPAEFPAHRAQVDWELGLVRASVAAWGPSIEALTRSIAEFERLHERRYATVVREILAEVYDRVGNPRAAWRHRMNVLRGIGSTVTPKLLVTLDSAARGAALDGNLPVSLSLLDLEAEMAEGSGDEMLRLQTFLFRARVEKKLGRDPEADADLGAAKALISHLKDKTFRERALADCLMVEAYLRPAAQAVALFDRALRFNETKGRRMLLPDLLLHRGRALASLGRGDEAAADFEAGIAELEEQRATIPAGEDRWGTFGTTEGLFEEAVAHAVTRGQTEAALRYSERARSRELLESMKTGGRADVIAASRAGDVVIVEYATLPASLIIFVLDRGSVRAVQHVVARSSLEADIANLRRSASERDEVQFRLDSAALYAHLVGPIAEFLSGTRHLAIVPDAVLREVPFAALLDPTGHYLVERFAISTPPSGEVFARLRAAERSSMPIGDVLVVEGPPSVERTLRHLRAADREAAAIAATYPNVRRIASASADETTIARSVPTVQIVHFVGHAVSDGGPYAALLTTVTPDAQSDGRLDVREIAAMRLPSTRVVVLAACATATGEERAGEGNISLARAFVAAGVPSVVATLWPIDDEDAAEFFPRLHRHLSRGLSAAEALRSAQIESIRTRGAPAMWAAVQVVGT